MDIDTLDRAIIAICSLGIGVIALAYIGACVGDYILARRTRKALDEYFRKYPDENDGA
jgi:hypothetical protein